MTFMKRLESLEQQLGGADPTNPARVAWNYLWGAARRALESHPAARAAAKEACHRNRSTWSSGCAPDMSFFVMSGTLWGALEAYPEANAALEEALKAVPMPDEVKAAFEEMDRQKAARLAAMPPMPRPGENPAWDNFCARMEEQGYPPDVENTHPAPPEVTPLFPGNQKNNGPAEGSAYTPRPAD
jgi:hypothetical protein